MRLFGVQRRTVGVRRTRRYIFKPFSIHITAAFGVTGKLTTVMRIANTVFYVQCRLCIHPVDGVRMLVA